MPFPLVAAPPLRHGPRCSHTIGIIQLSCGIARSLLELLLQMLLTRTRRSNVLFNALATNEVADLVALLL